jgi:hypothetical protein
LYSVVHGVVPSHGANVSSHLAVFQLRKTRQSSYHFNRKQHTCSTVTGIRVPWSFQMEVIPRLRAMTPVRIEFAVHLVEVGVVGVVFLEVLATGAAALLVTVEAMPRI